MHNTNYEQNIENLRDNIRQLNDEGMSIMMQYYADQTKHRKHATSGKDIGKVGIVIRRSKRNPDVDVYFYWGEYRANRSREQLESGKIEHFNEPFKKGGGKTFKYKKSAFKNVPLDWEWELIDKYEPRLALIREATKLKRDVIRAEKKASAAYKKAMSKDVSAD